MYEYYINRLKNYLLIIFISFGFATSLLAQISNKQSIIIDTDAATDDFRAIVQLLAINELSIKAITISDGSLKPIDGKQKIEELLYSLSKNDIPVSLGRSQKAASPSWNSLCKALKWGEQSILNNNVKIRSAINLLASTLQNNSQSVILVCLGPLTNISDLLKKQPEIKSKIKKILWYSDKNKGFNYEFDKLSADFVINSGVPIVFFSTAKSIIGTFDNTFIEAIEKTNTKYAQVISTAFRNKEFQEKTKHTFFFADDIIPAWFVCSNIFDFESNINNPSISYCVNIQTKALQDIMLKIYGQTYTTEKNIAFETFPMQAELFQFDLKDQVDTTIKKYGKEEWKACVLTNEIHGHLGVYSIIGAKMGVKARELLNAEVDRLKVHSFAGNMPPLSCLNDGLQISTGATLGLGNITIDTDTILRPEAIFDYKGKKIKLTLKKQYYLQVDKDINQGISKFGNLTDGYWKLIRKLSIQYWLEWNRNELFDIELIN